MSIYNIALFVLLNFFPLIAVNTDFRAIRRRFLFNHTDEMCFILVILQDIFPELQEEMTIGLLTISNGFIFSSVKATLTIRDDDCNYDCVFKSGQRVETQCCMESVRRAF